MTTSIELQSRAKHVRIQGDALILSLVDGRMLSVPLAWFPRLQGATQEQRDDWRLMGDGAGVHWDTLDEDVSVARLLGQECE